MSKFDLTMTYERSSDVPLGYVGDWPSSRYFDAPKPSFKVRRRSAAAAAAAVAVVVAGKSGRFSATWVPW